MASPFFRNHWNYYPQRPRYVPGMMEVPLHRRTVPVAPKVVSIPVRFVESKKTGSDSATKIQKVFRGFLVRKSVKKVVAIERDVHEIERRLADLETVNLIRKDVKERVKYGEMLMSLLFRLDSVKGVDPGIRYFRKAVIRKAIALQEKVDSIAASDEATDMFDATLEAGSAECDSEAVDQTSEMIVSGERESVVEEIPEIKGGIPEHEDVSSATDDSNGVLPASKAASVDDCNESLDGVISKPPAIEKEREIIEESRPQSWESNLDLEVPEADDLPKPQVSEHGENSPGEDEFVETVAEEAANETVHREIEAAMSEDESQTDFSNKPPNSEDGIAESGAVVERHDSGNEEDRGQSRELLERMMVDNKKAMEMMAQLVEKNELQSRLLSSLSHRVEQLEKALVYEMLRKKKRRNSVDCSEKSSKPKKSGK